MVFSKSWQSSTALFIAFGLSSTGVVPFLGVKGAIASEPILLAQVFSQPSPASLPAGTVIPTRYEEAEKIIVTPNETTEVTLTVVSDLRSTRGTIIIPAGSTIEGTLQPASEDTQEGTQFVAETLVLPNGRRYALDATSAVVTRTETITEDSDPDFLRGAAIGAAAAGVLSEIFGDIDFIEVLAGAGLGALASVLLRGTEETEVVVVYPDDLDLTLQSSFLLSDRSSRPTQQGTGIR